QAYSALTRTIWFGAFHYTPQLASRGDLPSSEQSRSGSLAEGPPFSPTRRLPARSNSPRGIQPAGDRNRDHRVYGDRSAPTSYPATHRCTRRRKSPSAQAPQVPDSDTPSPE